MARGIRTWQREALECYRARIESGGRTLLWEATPGAGKTRAALIVAATQLRSKRSNRLLVVVPTAHLKTQWARAAREFNIHLDTNYSAGALASDYHGVAVTYQQIAHSPGAFRSLAATCTAILDEVHHSADGLTWGNSLTLALADAKFILCLSGTAFRSDSNPIPFVQYNRAGESEPDFTYPYSRAIVEGVCRPTAFFAYGGEVAWAVEEATISAGFADNLDKHNSARRLRAALDPTSGWIDPILRDAHEMLTNVRKTQRNAGGLLVATNQEHARAFAKLVRTITGSAPIVVLSDDAAASGKIKSFALSDVPWLVACNMVSEGVDIPRLRVGVYGTTIRTRMYFRQFLGRIVRQTPEPAGVQVAYCYLPADPALQLFAREIENEQRHRLSAGTNEELFERLADFRREQDGDRPQFQAVHAVNSGVDTIIVNGSQLDLFGGAASASPEKHAELVERELYSRLEEHMTQSEVKEAIARRIKDLVAAYHRKSGQQYPRIHSALNKTQNVRSQAHCTVKQLEERVATLRNWLNAA